MLTNSEKRYYAWVTQYFGGHGEVVEIGTWLGLSTFHIVKGLQKNPLFSGKLHCFDDFVWRSEWMDKWLPGTSGTCPKNHESFEGLFRQLTAEWADLILATPARLAEYDGNENVAPLQWIGAPIEMCFVDCGRLMVVNDAWFHHLRPSFIPGRTLLVLQDWQHHKSMPETWWEQMKTFTDSKGEELELIHEVSGAGIGTFLFRG